MRRQGYLHPHCVHTVCSGKGCHRWDTETQSCQTWAREVDALLFSSFSSQDQRDVKHFGRAIILKTASVEQREGQEPSTVAQHRVGRAAPCQSPRSHPLSLRSSPSDAESNFPAPALDAGSRGSARLPHRQGRQQGLGTTRSWDWHPSVISSGGAIPDRILCSRSGNKPVMLSLSLHLFQHSWVGPWKFPIFLTFGHFP